MNDETDAANVVARDTGAMSETAGRTEAVSRAERRVLHQLLEAPLDDHLALDLAAAANIKPFRLYPVLHHLEESGFIASKWQAGQVGSRRRLYSLTPSGFDLAASQRELADHLPFGAFAPGST